MNPEVVYQSLREELLGAYTRQVNLVAFGFTATVALIGYNFTATKPNAWLFLLPLLILGLLFVQLNNTIYTIFTISIYIRVFIEREYDLPRWETNISALRSYLRDKKPFKLLRPYNPVTMFDGLLYALATTGMGFVCIGLFWYTSQAMLTAIILAVSWLGGCVLLFRPLKFVNTGRYEEELEQVWQQLKKEII
jgi:hypothetical protein